MQQSYAVLLVKKMLRLNKLSVFTIHCVRIFKYTRNCFAHDKKA